MLAAAGFRVLAADDHDHFEAALFEALSHFNRHNVAPARRRDERTIFRPQIEVAQNSFGKAADVFQEHRLTLPVWPDDEVVKAKGKFNDRIEPRKRTITRPHFLHKNPAVTRSK